MAQIKTNLQYGVTGTIPTANIADDAITSAKLADDSVVAAAIADNAVVTAAINADAITAAKVADDVINSEHLVDGGIDTAHIADDQITLAKMASGTDGNVITYDASGNPAVVATGTSGHFLKSQGAGSVPVFAAAAGSTNTPYFHMKRGESSGNQTISQNTWTIVDLDTSVLDSGSGVDTSNKKYVIPSGQGGVWYIYGQLSFYFSPNDAQTTYFKITGTTELAQNLPLAIAMDNVGRHFTFGYSLIHNFSAGNEISVYCYVQGHEGNGGLIYPALTNSNNMMGFKLAV